MTASTLSTPDAPQTYQAFGLIVRSSLPLPLWSEASAALAPDVSVRLGAVPHTLPEVAGSGACFECNPREVLVRLKGAFGMYLREGHCATIEIESGTPESVPRLFFQNVASSLLLHQRGRIVLHACAVSVDGAGVAFAGPSGAGKSVLGVLAHRRGYALVTDEVCALAVDNDQRPWLLPGYGHVQLWRDAIDVLGLTPGPVVRPDLARHYVSSGKPPPRPVPLRRLYVLSAQRDAPLTITRVTGRDRLTLLAAQTHHKTYLPGMHLALSHFRACMAMAPHIDVFRCSRPGDFAEMDRILDHAADTALP